MNKEEYMLTIVSEESGEIVQAADKILRFGKNNFNPVKPEMTNEYHLLQEYYQLQVMIEHMQSEGMIRRLTDDEIARIKRHKLEKVYEYAEESKARGILVNDSEEIIHEKAKAFDEISKRYDDVSLFDDDGSESKEFASEVCGIICRIENLEKENLEKENLEKEKK